MTVDPAGHLPLAASIAQRYGRIAPDPAAVLEVAVGALLVAAKGFQPSRGTWVSTLRSASSGPSRARWASVTVAPKFSNGGWSLFP